MPSGGDRSRILILLGLGTLATVLGPPLTARVRKRYPNADGEYVRHVGTRSSRPRKYH
jgi:hypothetical protein